MLYMESKRTAIISLKARSSRYRSPKTLLGQRVSSPVTKLHIAYSRETTGIGYA